MTQHLGYLLGSLHSARKVLDQRRQATASWTMVDDARADVLSALESYVAALEDLRLPVPYAMRDELRLARDCRSPSRS